MWLIRGGLLASLLLLGACTATPDAAPATPTVTPSATASIPAAPAGLDAEGAAAWEQWQTLGLDSYRYRLDARCFCPPASGQVVVRDGTVVSFDGKRYHGERLTGFDTAAPTIDTVFRQLADAMQHADQVTARYDDVTGVPTRIDVDWITNGIDDEITYLVSGVTPIASD